MARLAQPLARQLASPLGRTVPHPAIEGVGVPAWLPTGALAYGDFINDRYYLGGAVVSRSTFLGYTRSGTAYDLGNAAGDIGTYAANAVRLNDRGLLIEPAVQNDNQRSNVYANAQWTNTGVDISAPAVGGFTPVTELAPSTLHRLFKGTGINVVNGATKSFIWTLKNRGRRYVWMRIIPDGATSHNVGFDLDNITTTFVSSGFTASISKVGSTYFAIASFTTGTTSISVSLGASNAAISSDTVPSAYVGDTLQGFDIFNLDCIDGSVLRSPIITDTVAVQRPADAYSTTFAGAGSHPVTFTFDDDTKDVISGVSAGAYAYPTNLSRPLVKSVVWGDV